MHTLITPTVVLARRPALAAFMARLATQRHAVSIPSAATLPSIAALTYLFGTLAIIFSATIPRFDPKTARNGLEFGR